MESTQLNIFGKPDGPKDPEKIQQDLLRAANEAAKAGDAAGMVEALYASQAVSGIRRGLKGTWSGLSQTDVDYAVNLALEVVFVAIRRGDKIVDIMPYLYKVARRKASDVYADLHPVPTVDATRLGNRRTDPARDVPAPVERDPAEVRAELRAKALAEARRLLPKLGEGNVIQVMEYVFTRIERGLPVEPHQIAVDLTLSEGSVRVWLSRGWQRLERAAKAEGLVNESFTLQDIRENTIEDTLDDEEDN